MNEIDGVEIKTTNNTDFTSVPEGAYEVVISNIQKKERSKYQAEGTETVFLFEFTILTGEEQDKKVFDWVRPVLGKKPNPSKLYKIWKAVEAREISEEEFPNLHVSGFLNKNISVVIENKTVGDREFSNVKNYLKGTLSVDVDEMAKEAMNAVK